MGERMFIVDCDVLQADGGTRTAAITGGYVALARAARRLAQDGIIPPNLIRTSIAAVSVGLIEGQPRLDLCYDEDNIAEVDLNVVMTGEGEFVEVQGTAEGAPFSKTALDEMLALAHKGVAELIAAQREALQ
jgi:ribonuclease PH